MATINYTIEKTANPLVWVVSWLGVTNADTCVPFDVSTVPGAGGTDRSIHVVGTFGTDAALLTGSNDGVNFAALNDAEGNSIALGSTGLVQVLEYTRAVAPLVTGGAGGDLDFYLLVKGSR